MDVTFSHNAAVLQGGGMYISNADNVTLDNVLFHKNKAGTYGGVLSADSTIAVLTNVAFFANEANSWGGGLFSSWGSIGKRSLLNQTLCEVQWPAPGRIIEVFR